MFKTFSCDCVFLQKQLQAFYPGREEENIVMLVNAAETELGAKDAETIDYKSLFMEVRGKTCY